MAEILKAIKKTESGQQYENQPGRQNGGAGDAIIGKSGLMSEQYWKSCRAGAMASFSLFQFTISMAASIAAVFAAKMQSKQAFAVFKTPKLLIRKP